MTPNNEPGGFLPNNQDFKLNRTLLRSIVRQRWRAWLVCGVLILTASLLYGLLFYPQSFPSTVSISMQQPSAPTNPLIALTGGGGNKKYLGIIRSRRFADAVENRVSLRELYGLPATQEGTDEIVDRMMKTLKVEDNAGDGLLYITVNLDGPPRLAPDPQGNRSKIENAAAKAANVYADELQQYMIKSDTDKELALLRSAENLMHKAEQNYNTSVSHLADFVKNSHAPVMAQAASGGTTSDTVSAGSQLQTLYLRRGQLDAQIKSEEVIRKSTVGILQGPSKELTSLPTEDKLLTEARKEVNDAAFNLENLQITLDRGAPSVRRAEERLKLAQKRLVQQVKAILQGNTTDEVKRQALQAEHDVVTQQINLAERNFQLGRRIGTDFDRLRKDVDLKLEVLKTTATRYAELQIQTVSAKNRMVVVDRARPPKFGKPGITLVGTLSVFGSVFVVAFWAVSEYLLRSQREEA